jgi:hypothetical protein
MIPVTSSNIEAIGYNEPNEILYIRFKGGKVYSYERVPSYTYDELMAAESVGKFFNQSIKNQFVTRVENL